MYSAFIRSPFNEEFFHHDLHELFNIVISHGIELIREYGMIGNYDIIRIYDQDLNEVCSIHFGQPYSLIGTDYSSVSVRSYKGNNNINKQHFYEIRRYKL